MEAHFPGIAISKNLATSVYRYNIREDKEICIVNKQGRGGPIRTCIDPLSGVSVSPTGT
jgi:hypothetical protein